MDPATCFGSVRQCKVCVGTCRAGYIGFLDVALPRGHEESEKWPAIPSYLGEFQTIKLSGYLNVSEQGPDIGPAFKNSDGFLRIAFGSPSYAADLPTYREQGTIYQRESHTYEREYRQVEPRVRVVPRVVETPVVEETVVVRRPVVVTRPRVVVEEYPVYEAPVYGRPRIYAYSGPRWRHHFWSGRPHFAGRW